MRAAALAAAGLALACAVPAGALAGGWHAPRNAWGAPDLNGLWTNNSLTQLERDDAFKALVPPEAEVKAYEAKHLGKPPEIPEDTVGGAASEYWETDVGLARIRGQARTSWITSPADGQLPFTAKVKAEHKARKERRKLGFDGPEAAALSERCLDHSASGPPLMNGGYNDNYRFVQTGDTLAILAEYTDDTRIVRLAPGAAHPPLSVRRWMGDSIGHWEGETLVVETTNFAPAEVGAKPEDANADMRVVERFTRTGPDAIAYEFRVTDPSLFVQTWSGEMVFRPTKGPIYEFACHEGNYALPDMLSGSRHAEAAGGATTASAAAAK